MKDFRQLKVWERAHQLTLAVYRATTTFPRDETYGLSSQMRPCCIIDPVKYSGRLRSHGQRGIASLLAATGCAKRYKQGATTMAGPDNVPVGVLCQPAGSRRPGREMSKLQTRAKARDYELD